LNQRLSFDIILLIDCRKEAVMLYSFELINHANIHYRKSIEKLARCELFCMLRSLHVAFGEISVSHIGHVVFLSFETEKALSENDLLYLSRHSSVSLMAEQHESLLKPISVCYPGYLQEDLPEILKYKGKTGVPFTRFMINTALSLSDYSHSASPITLLDPLCGRGTSLFCAAQAGMNAVGLDQDKKAVQEADKYFSRYLQTYHLKHVRSSSSETAKGQSLPVISFTFSDTKEHAKAGDSRFLRIACGDSSLSSVLTRRTSAHILVADLPYGVQHAPREAGSKPESFSAFLRRCLGGWFESLLPGGVIALSFNELTLPAKDLLTLLSHAGFSPLQDEPLGDLRHEVEQAVSRNVLFALKQKEASSS